MQLQATNNRVSTTDMIISESGLKQIKGWANLMAGSNMIPDHFKNCQYDCAIVTTKALSLGLDPVAMAQEVFPVKGKMTYGAKLIIAMIHQSNLIEPRTFTRQIGDWTKIGKCYNGRFANESGLGIQVGFKFKGDEEVTWGSPLMLEAQTTRNSPLWQTDPMQQLTYLAAKRWSSVYAPAITMGMMLVDEVDNEKPVEEKDITPTMDTESSSFTAPVVEQPVEDQADIEEAIQASEQNEAAVAGEVVQEEVTTDKTQAVTEVKEPEKEIVVNNSTAVETSEPSPAAATAPAIEDAEVVTPEPTAESAPEQDEDNAPAVGQLDPAGKNKFNPQYHTGTILKSTKEWRIKNGMKEEYEQMIAAQSAPAAEEQPAAESAPVVDDPTGKLLRPVTEDAIDVLGEEPVRVTAFNSQTLEIEIEGNTDDVFPLIDEDTGDAHFELVKEEAAEPAAEEQQASEELFESLLVMDGQRNAGIEKLKGNAAHIKDEANRAKAIETIAKWEKEAVTVAKNVANKGNAVTEADIESIKKANMAMWEESQKAIKFFMEKEQEDNPFM